MDLFEPSFVATLLARTTPLPRRDDGVSYSVLRVTGNQAEVYRTTPTERHSEQARRALISALRQLPHKQELEPGLYVIGETGFDGRRIGWRAIFESHGEDDENEEIVERWRGAPTR